VASCYGDRDDSTIFSGRLVRHDLLCSLVIWEGERCVGMLMCCGSAGLSPAIYDPLFHVASMQHHGGHYGLVLMLSSRLFLRTNRVSQRTAEVDAVRNAIGRTTWTHLSLSWAQRVLARHALWKDATHARVAGGAHDTCVQQRKLMWAICGMPRTTCHP